MGGTEIKKDKLTEDQLLPLKDLPLEHRDALALIVARDEMPVSDVKKIAKLFKDKTISDSTKDKLLFKTGSGLLETWSTHEQNKAERAKPAEPKAAPIKADKAETATKSETADASAIELSPIELKLQQLAAALPEHSPLSPAILQSLQSIKPGEQEVFMDSVNSLINNLEKHLAEWQKIKELAKPEA